VEAAEKQIAWGGYYQYILGYFEFDNTTYNHTYSDMDGIKGLIAFSGG
jgi:hypothetical protein